MRIHRIAAPALALLLMAAGFGFGAKTASAQDRDHDRDRDWQAPPRELNEIQQRGFREGIEGARKDFENHRQPNVENRDEFRRPDLPGNLRDAYRDGFRRGYQVGVDHIYRAQQFQQAPPPPPPPAVNGWQGLWENRQFNDLERRGFEDGRVGAQRDLENHRRPDPNNRDEYRDVRMPPEQAEQYRSGFRRGYEEQIAQTFGVRQDAPWDFVPDRFSEIGQRGFHDGVDGARHDIENHRRPDPNNRDEYRSPHVPPQLVDDYREGFRLGYERAIAHFMNGQPGY
jgi:ribosome modulation factor